ncbi:MAG: hypothetical protein ACSLFH_00905 [Desulfuromonadales bacterium]
MLFNSRKVSLRPLLILLIGFAAILLFALLVREIQGDSPLFSLSHVSVENQQEPGLLTLSGHDFHPGIEGVLASNLVNEKALLWHHLVGIPAKAVDVMDDLALVSCYGKKIVSIGLNGGMSPKLLGSLELPASVYHIKIVGDQALAAMSAPAGFSLIDLKDPSDMKLGRYFHVPGVVTSMVADRNIIYYVNLHRGVGRIDLSVENPAPENLVDLDSPLQIALQGSRLAVATTKGLVHLFNLTQGGQPTAVGTLHYPDIVTGVAFTEGALAVALNDGDLHVLSLSSWPKLDKSVQLHLPGRPLLLERVPGRASIAASLVSGGVALIDVSLPVAPVLSGHLKMNKTFKGTALQTDKIFATSLAGLEVFSLDEIAKGEYSKLATDAMLEQKFYHLQTWNGHVYGYKNSRLVDFGRKGPADPHSSGRLMAVANMEGVSFFEPREYGQAKKTEAMIRMEGVRSAGFRDNHLYIIHNGGLRILRGARPEEMVVVSDLELPGGLGPFAFIDPGYLLVATRYKGLLVVDVHDPQRPVQVASLTLPQHQQTDNLSRDVLIDGRFAYISQGSAGVLVVDVSSPAQPLLIQMIDTPGYAKKMALHDNLLLVADGFEGLFMIDVKDRNGALPIGSLPVPIFINQVAVTGNSMIVSNLAGGTMRLPLPQRLEDLHVISDGELRANVEMVDKGQYVYLYDERHSRKIEVDVQ